ncbi:MAG: type II toxin-antitoxin system PemK/MazF family toxin [Acidobacteriota bacterium]
MKAIELKIARIGNSKGVRVPAATLRRYGIGATIVMEERSDGIMLRPAGRSVAKLSWEDTAREMAFSGEDWSEWDPTTADGLKAHPWDAGKPPSVAERDARYKAIRRHEAPKRYEIRWADLEPTQGAEMSKERPVVIVSLDILNGQLQTVTVCPLTTSIHPTWRSRLQVRIGRRNAEIAVDQIRTISKCRIGSKVGVLSEDDAAVLRRIITEMYGE